MDNAMTVDEFLAQWHNDSPTLLVNTSGSTGSPKPIRVEKQRMLNSARITCDFLGLRPNDTALLCLSPSFIAGKMMIVRAQERSLRLTVVPPTGHPLASLPVTADDTPNFSLAAMVPMQVFNTLQEPAERQRLMGIRHLLIGGGAIHPELAAELRNFPHAVWSTYGMTETLSHIALRRLSGPESSEWYTPFNGVTVGLAPDGCLTILAPAVHDGLLFTRDIAEMHADGRRFRIIGRKDNVVCSGGVKIQMEEVEQLLRPHVNVPFFMTKLPDKKLGEQLVLLTESNDVDSLHDLCRRILPKYWQPRFIITVDHLPYTPTGKPARYSLDIKII